MRTALQILLVRKHQQQRVLHLTILDDTGELRPCLVDAVAVIRVDDEDKALGTCTTPLAHTLPEPRSDKDVYGVGEDKANACDELVIDVR